EAAAAKIVAQTTALSFDASRVDCRIARSLARDDYTTFTSQCRVVCDLVHFSRGFLVARGGSGVVASRAPAGAARAPNVPRRCLRRPDARAGFSTSQGVTRLVTSCSKMR